MSRPLLIAALLLTAPLGACASVGTALNGPKLAPMNMSSALAPPAQQVLGAAVNEPQAASANSLWRVGARTFFQDQRASRVGDILTVLIEINDSATISNATEADKTGQNQIGVTNLFGLEKLLSKVMTPSSVVNTNTSSTSKGTGTIARQEQITLTIAAVVTQVLPNGNLIIEGRQEMKTNNDLRLLTVAGVARPEDITSSNTILHTQLAELRVNYGGAGDLAAVQKTSGGTALLNRFNPF
jgi:flagellar L-ring protein precursor FlgH